jgi:hypothetical protein
MRVSVGIKRDLGKALIANNSGFIVKINNAVYIAFKPTHGRFTGAYSHRCYFLKGTVITAKYRLDIKPL